MSTRSGPRNNLLKVCLWSEQKKRFWEFCFSLEFTYWFD
jgi:hypothetical protein